MKEILYFGAEWCNPCQRTKPVAEQLKNEGLINFTFIDADSEIDMIEKFDIKSIPTYILIEDGREAKRMNGTKTREQFLAFVED